MQKDHLNVHVFQSRDRGQFTGGKYGGTGLASEKAEALDMQKLRNSGSSRQ